MSSVIDKLTPAMIAFQEIYKTLPPLQRNYAYFWHFTGTNPGEVDLTDPETIRRIELLLTPHAATIVKTWAVKRVAALLPDEE